MSLADLTRNSFQSGLSASKWMSLCKLFIAKEVDLQTSGNAESALSNSVLSVLRFYPGDPDLQQYLKCAIQEGILSLATFVSTLLQAARSPDLHNPATLDMLCRIALDAHYSSGLSIPVGSIVPFAESAIVVLGTVQDAMALLRIAHSLPISHFHQLQTSASEIVILLLSCVSDMSQVSTAQAMVHFADANDLLQNLRLTPEVRSVLEGFMLSLSLLIGDDAKAAREAQMMHSLQVALGRGDVLGPNSSTDTVSFGLLLHHMISQRARPFGSGSSAEMIALLVGTFQWSSWPPPVFYTQLFITLLLSLAQSQLHSALLWRDFILGRLPSLLISFEQAIKNDTHVEADWRSAIQTAIATAVQRDIIRQCDHTLNTSNSDGVGSLLPDLLGRLVSSKLLDDAFVESVGVREWKTSDLQVEASSLDLDLEAYIDSKIIIEAPPYDDLYALIDRICKDPVSHAGFSHVISQRFSSLSAVFDVEALSRICKVLYMHNRALDILSLHIKMESLLTQILTLVDRYDCETIGDPQTAVTHLGDIVLFGQHALAHFSMDSKIIGDGVKTVAPRFLQSTCDVFPPDMLSSEDTVAFSAWFKTLFDSSSEGIEDTILRASRPKTLLKMTASLFASAIKARIEGKIDGDVLNNGISFFTGPLLSWTLVGVVKSLLKEIHRKFFRVPVHLEVLQTLLLSSSCPKPVLVLCGSQIMAVFASKMAKQVLSNPHIKFDLVRVQQAVSEALGSVETARIQRILSAGASNTWSQDSPRQIIHRALTVARSAKIASIDVGCLVKSTTPTKLIQMLWSEVSMAASMGDMENCRRIATFLLTIPPNPISPPLLPLFLHRVLPSIILSVDALETTQQTPNVELLVILVSSVLTSALHLELALRGTQWETRSVLGENIISMAKRLALDLRGMKKSYTATAIVQRLGSAQSFVSNFPVFMPEAGN